MSSCSEGNNDFSSSCQDEFYIIRYLSCILSSGSEGNQGDFSSSSLSLYLILWFLQAARAIFPSSDLCPAFCHLVLPAIRTIFPSSGLSLHFVSGSAGSQDDFSFIRSLCILSSGSAGGQDDFSFIRSLSAFCSLVLHATRTSFPSLCFSLYFVIWFCLSRKIFPVTPMLHCLPEEQRIEYKLSLLCFTIISDQAPIYCSDFLHLYIPSRQLRSSAIPRVFRKSSFRTKCSGHAALCLITSSNLQELFPRSCPSSYLTL